MKAQIRSRFLKNVSRIHFLQDRSDSVYREESRIRFFRKIRVLRTDPGAALCRMNPDPLINITNPGSGFLQDESRIRFYSTDPGSAYKKNESGSSFFVGWIQWHFLHDDQGSKFYWTDPESTFYRRHPGSTFNSTLAFVE